MSNTALHPDYQKLVGIWKRMFMNNQPDPAKPFMAFNSNATFFAVNPNGAPFFGKVTNLQAITPTTGKITLLFLPIYRTEVWEYRLDENRGFKAEYVPTPGRPHPPQLNELFMFKDDLRLLYAFRNYSAVNIDEEKDFGLIHDVP